MHSIYYASLSKGTTVHSKDGYLLCLTADKRWSDRTIQAVVVYGPNDQIGRHE